MTIAVLLVVGGSEEASAGGTPPVAAYSFDAGEGEVAEDSAGEHDGALEGPEWSSGKFGKSLRFDGENDCVTVPESADFELGEEFTLEAWVKPGTSPLAFNPVIYKEVGGGAIGYSLGIGFLQDGKPEAYVGEEGGYEHVQAEDRVEDHVWTHLAATYDNAHLRLYVNGELAASEETHGGRLGGGALRIGCDEETEEGEYFQGRIDEVRVYNRALDEAEATDTEAPSFVNPFVVIPFTYNENTSVWFSEAVDKESSSAPLSPAKFYFYRYAVNSGPFGRWHLGATSTFDLPGVSYGDNVTVEAYASDAAGNRSRTESGSAVVSEEEEANEPTEAELEDAETEPNLESGPPAISYFRTLKVGESRAAGIPSKALPNECQTSVGEPHISEHARREGHIRINAVGFVKCGFVGISGWVSVRLMRLGPYGPFEVSSSGRSAFVVEKAQKKYYAIIEPYDCEVGKYYAFVTSYLEPPPGVTPAQGPLKSRSSGIRRIDVCR